MIDDQTRELMSRHGITATQQTVYHYKGYGNLADALNYAELLTDRAYRAAASAPSRRLGT